MTFIQLIETITTRRDELDALAELSDSPPIFRNLDVERVDELSTDP